MGGSSVVDVMGIFWLVYCEAFAVALFLVARAFHKYLVMPRLCTAKATGTVTGYSRFVMGASGYAPPRVRYEAGGVEYVVRGPLYSSYRTVSRTAPWLSNRMTTPMVGSHKTDQVFRAHYDVNGVVGIKAPALEMFPVGAELDVFYDPLRPKLAYVERCPKLRWVFVLSLSLALACAVTGAALFAWMHGAYLANTYYVSPTGETVHIDQDFFSNEKIRKVDEDSFVVEDYGMAEDAALAQPRRPGRGAFRALGNVAVSHAPSSLSAILGGPEPDQPDAAVPPCSESIMPSCTSSTSRAV
jgi:hypothetical protein